MILLRALWQPMGIFGWAAMLIIIMALGDWESQDSYLHLALQLLFLEWLRQVLAFYFLPRSHELPRESLRNVRDQARDALENSSIFGLQKAVLALLWHLSRGIWRFCFPPAIGDAPTVFRARVWIVCLLSLLLPPFGFLYCLLFDTKNRRVARLAGRNAVRGALILSVIGWVALLNWEVNIAIHSITLARLEPVNEAKVDRIVAYKKNLRHQKQRALSSRI